MIKNYIFDFGNVLGEFYPERLTAPFVSDEEERKIISEIAFDRLYLDRLDDGSITDDEVKAAIRKRAEGERGEMACKVYDNWINSMTPVKNMKEIIFDLHKSGKKLYLLSNISTGFAEGYKEVKWIKEILNCFDGLVFSGVIKMAKPDRKIFEYILSEHNLKAEESLFIDDNPKNIESAKSLGIEGYLFDGDAKKLRGYIGI